METPLARRLQISFSGGETSAFMTWWLLNHARDRWDDIVVVFANTGQENEETLEFIKRCDDYFGFGTEWIEAVQYHGRRLNPTYRIVDFETASRDGAPFEDMIRKYGIPNYKFKHCTRALKTRPIEAYARAYGWADGTYDTAIGIRVDEVDRMSVNASKRRLVYPLIQLLPMTKPKINAWWDQQPFRLRLKGYQGNCSWCWKKSFRKHFTLIGENPKIYDFPRRMEMEYGLVGAEFRHDPATRRSPLGPDYRRVFFRGSKSTDDLFEDYRHRPNSFVPAEDDAVVFDPDLDVGAGCEESCEAFADEDEEEDE